MTTRSGKSERSTVCVAFEPALFAPQEPAKHQRLGRLQRISLSKRVGGAFEFLNLRLPTTKSKQDSAVHTLANQVDLAEWPADGRYPLGVLGPSCRLENSGFRVISRIIELPCQSTPSSFLFITKKISSQLSTTA